MSKSKSKIKKVEKKTLTKFGVFGIIVKRAGETGLTPWEPARTHLENYIVQDHKNKQVIQETVKQVGKTCKAENESF